MLGWVCGDFGPDRRASALISLLCCQVGISNGYAFAMRLQFEYDSGAVPRILGILL